MSWILGMDLRPYGSGAVRFAAWLAKASRAPDGERFVPMHVLEDEHLRHVLRLHHLDDVTRSAREATSAALEGVGAGPAFEPPEIIVGGRAEDGLARGYQSRGAQGILIGRMAKREGFAIVRLGTVARRLLRRAPGPVFVVPPDFEPERAGMGPVVALTALHEAPSACRFAEWLGSRLGREVLIAHAVAPPDNVTYMSAATLEKIARERRAEAEQALAGWGRSHGLSPHAAVVIEGTPLEAALTLARERAAPLLVAGTPGSSGQPWVPSFARELAAHAPVPVAVVPE